MSVSNRKKDDQSNGAHVKLRWLELDVDGGTADLVEGFRSFAAALTRSSPLTMPARTLAAPKPPTGASTAVIDTAVPMEENNHTAETMDEVVSERNVDGADRPKRRPAPKAPQFLNDLDLTKASVQLADFVQEKNADGDMDRYAVIAAWYKEHLGTEEITIDHVFTAYKALGWQTQLPSDPSQTFRNLKSNKNWFDGGSKRGAYKINWNGVNAVNKMGTAKS